MNKLIIVAMAFFTTLPVVAMNIMTLTETESKNFTKLLSNMVTFGKAMIEANKISENHPLHCMHSQLSKELASCKGNLLETIKKNNNLQDIIQRCADAIEDTEDVQDLRKQMFDQLTNKEPKDVETVRTEIWTRKMCSDVLLQELQPIYFKNLLDKTDEENRAHFMINNANYPTNEEAQENYIAILIYRRTLAQRIPYDLKYLLGSDNFKEM